MILDKLKKTNKGSPYFVPIIVFLLAISINFGFSVYRNYQAETKTTAETQQTEQNGEQDNKDTDKNDDEKEPLINFHVGISNVVVFGALTVALLIVKHRDNLSSSKQKETSFSEDKE